MFVFFDLELRIWLRIEFRQRALRKTPHYYFEKHLRIEPSPLEVRRILVYSFVSPTWFLCFYIFFILQDSPNITDMNKTSTLQNLHTIRAGTSHRDNLQLWGPLQ